MGQGHPGVVRLLCLDHDHTDYVPFQKLHQNILGRVEDEWSTHLADRRKRQLPLHG